MGWLMIIKLQCTYVVNDKSWCFAGFCHHHLATTSAHTHVYRYPLFESGMNYVG